MRVGDTFLGGLGETKHLWVASAQSTDGNIVAFNFSSLVDGCDESCVVHPGEHPFVKHTTVVRYGDGLIWTPETQRIVDGNPDLMAPRSPVAAPLLAYPARRSRVAAHEARVQGDHPRDAQIARSGR